MKKLLVFILLVTSLASCDVIVVDPEPAYDQRDKFTGNFDVEEYSSTYDEHWEYGLSVYKTGYGNGVILDNFYNSGLRVYGTVTGNRVYIAWQTVDGFEIQGEGSLNGNKLMLNYQVRDTYEHHAPNDFCSATGWRSY
jgi:hypothetical protein